MAKMTNNQKVSMDILARICNYFACDLQKVVIYVNEIDNFMNKIRSQVVDCGYTLFLNEWPEYQFQLNDSQMVKLKHINDFTIQSTIKQCECAAVTKIPINRGIMDTTKYNVVAGRNMVIMQGSLSVIELFIPWYLQMITN